MSKLYIKDLERIKNGKIVRYNENTKEKYSSFISLANLSNEISELRKLRFDILQTFKEEVNKELDWLKGCRIDDSYNISFNPCNLFLKDYLLISIPTILGQSDCLFNKEKLVGANGEISRDLIVKSQRIIPYVKKLYNIKEQSKLLDNNFYESYPVFDSNNEKVFNINGDGITLPFKEYPEFDDSTMQDILGYYYNNYFEILKNVLIPNTELLNTYRRDINREKVLKLYKGEE